MAKKSQSSYLLNNSHFIFSFLSLHGMLQGASPPACRDRVSVRQLLSHVEDSQELTFENSTKCKTMHILLPLAIRMMVSSRAPSTINVGEAENVRGRSPAGILRKLVLILRVTG